MHGMRSAEPRRAVLTFLVAVWVLTVPGRTAMAAEERDGAASGRPAAGLNAVLSAAYLSAGVASIRSRDTRFVDGEDSGHAALYGSREFFDAGAIVDGLQLHVAAGARLPYRFRAQLELGLAHALDWRGNANYRDSGGRQPTEASLDARQILLAAFHDFPGWEIVPGSRIRPFVGAGLGITDYRLSGYVQRFPAPDDPRGNLRRGPGGEIPFTALPGGKGRNLTWMLAAGIAVPIGENVLLDLSYRYTDAGKIRTDTGDIAIVRYREDGTRREIPVRIDETTADHRTHSLLAAVRLQF